MLNGTPNRTEEGILLRLRCSIVTQLNIGIYNNATANCINTDGDGKNPKEKKEERKKGVTQSLIFVRDYYAAFPTDGSITQCCIRPSLRLL